ncbi:MAG: DMT family transporter [Clostridia bacterium]
MKTKIKANIYLWLTAIIWGLAFVAQRIGGDHISAFAYNGIRFFIGAITLIPVFLIFEKNKGDAKKQKLTLITGVVCGIILFLASSLQQLGIVTTGAGKAGFLTGLYTVIVPIIGFFIGRKTTIFTWIGVICAAFGLYLLSFQGSFSITSGDIMLISCAFLFAFQMTIIDKYIPNINPLRFSFWQFITTAVLSSIVSLIFETVSFNDIKLAAWPILYGGFLSVGVAYTLQILGQRDSDPTYAAIVFSTESVFAAIGGMLFLGELMPVQGYIGGALIFAGIIISQFKKRSKSNAKV